MTRPTRLVFDSTALLHNLNRVKQSAPNQAVMAIVKANAYGCGIEQVIPVLEGRVAAFGVASLPEAQAIRRLGSVTDCVLLQGVFSADELLLAASIQAQCVIHHRQQLDWLRSVSLTAPLTVWIKVNTGMSRLGFLPSEVGEVASLIRACPQVAPTVGLMTHFACADEVGHPSNASQLQQFKALTALYPDLRSSLANSAAVLSLSDALGDVVRPGIMLYGVSPFSEQSGRDLGLVPVARLMSAVTAIHHYPPRTPIGYSQAWCSDQAATIGIIPVGYADGYPRGISPQTPIWVNGVLTQVVGRVSMDMMTIDLTRCPDVVLGSSVELWGKHLPIETIAASAGTIAYELLTKVTPRAREPGC